MIIHFWKKHLIFALEIYFITQINAFKLKRHETEAFRMNHSAFFCHAFNYCFLNYFGEKAFAREIRVSEVVKLFIVIMLNGIIVCNLMIGLEFIEIFIRVF